MVCVHTSQCAWRWRKGSNPSVVHWPLVSQDWGEWEREREREKGERDKENGCKRFGSWYLGRRCLKMNPSGDHFEGSSSPRNGRHSENSSRTLVVSVVTETLASSAKCRDVRGVTRIWENGSSELRGNSEGGMCHGLGITILFHRALIIRPAIAILCGNVGGVRSKRGSWLSVSTFMLKETRSRDQTTTATIGLHGNSRFAQLTIHRCLFFFILDAP